MLELRTIGIVLALAWLPRQTTESTMSDDFVDASYFSTMMSTPSPYSYSGSSGYSGYSGYNSYNWYDGYGDGTVNNDGNTVNFANFEMDIDEIGNDTFVNNTRWANRTRPIFLRPPSCEELLHDSVLDVTLSPRKGVPPNKPTLVKTKFVILSLNDVSDKSGTISLAARIEFRWNDHRIRVGGNKSDPCYDTELLFPAKSLWFPYWSVQNSATQMFMTDAWKEFPVITHWNGDILWLAAFKFDLSCDTDLTLFPFDTQYCMLLLQSPHYTSKRLMYYVANTSRGIVMLDSNQNHPTFSITGQLVRLTMQVPGLQFWMALERASSYYVWTIIIPTIVVSVTTGSVFIVPGRGDEKMTTAVTGMLGYFFLFAIVTEALPEASHKSPIILPFFVFNIVLSLAVVVLTAIIIRLARKNEMEDEVVNPESEIRRIRSAAIEPSVFREDRVMLAAMASRRGAVTANGAIPVKPPPPRPYSASALTRFRAFWKSRSAAEQLNTVGLVAYFVITIIAYSSFSLHLLSLYDDRDSLAPVEVKEILQYIIGEE